MKESLFEILLNLFEKTLMQLKEKHQSVTSGDSKVATELSNSVELDHKNDLQLHFVRAASEQALRVFTREEQIKLSKASLQLLVRMVDCGVLHTGLFELILNRLLLSDSRIVSVQETKWVIRNILSETLSAGHLAFLELILYHQEDGALLH